MLNYMDYSLEVKRKWAIIPSKKFYSSMKTLSL
jgi:hypothetical protein